MERLFNETNAARSEIWKKRELTRNSFDSVCFHNVAHFHLPSSSTTSIHTQQSATYVANYQVQICVLVWNRTHLKNKNWNI